MRNIYYYLILLSVIVFCSCTSKPTSKVTLPKESLMESTELTVLDRKALTYDKNKILEVLGVKEMGGHFIDLKICVIPNGKIVYAEILEEETKLDIPVEKKKEFLRAIYEIEFNKSSKKEDCGLFKVE